MAAVDGTGTAQTFNSVFLSRSGKTQCVICRLSGKEWGMRNDDRMDK